MLVHASELAGPGSFLTMTHFGRPLLVSRNDAGEARVFLNVCRHRGTQLMRVESGTAKRFTCGYHAWSYDTDGALKSVPRAACFPSVKLGERNLVSLPVVEAHGFLWLMPEPGQSRAELDAYLGPVATTWRRSSWTSTRSTAWSTRPGTSTGSCSWRGRWRATTSPSSTRRAPTCCSRTTASSSTTSGRTCAR